MTHRDGRKHRRSRLWAAAGLSLLVALGGCGLDEVEVPELEGPSGLGLGIRMTATPDIITADGFSSSLVTVNLADQNGQPLAGREIFFSVSDLGGNFADIGTLRSTGADRGVGTGLVVRTDGGGAARVAYVAPPRTDMTANNAVIVAARPVGEDARGQNYRTVEIELRSAEPRLFPPAPAGNAAPSCSFIVEAPGARCDTPVPAPAPSAPPSPAPPTPPPSPPAVPQVCSVRVNTSVLFQTTASDPDGIIVRFQWFFGDGTTPEYFPDTNHVFRTPGTYSITHVVTDNFGAQSACQASLTVIP